MAWWGVIKHAAWGEIAKAAARVPEFVREFRKPADAAEPSQPTTSTAIPDAEQLKAEIDRLKTNLERIRSFSEAQASAMDAQSKALAQSLKAMAARIRTLTWIAALAVATSIGVLIYVVVH